MGRAKVNSDAFIYTVPSPEAGKSPVPRSALRGEVIELDKDQEHRGRETEITRHYVVGTTTVPSREPALVDESYDEVGRAVDAAKAARRAQLVAELDALGPDSGTVPVVNAEPANEPPPGGDDDTDLRDGPPPAPPAAPGRTTQRSGTR